METLIKIIGGVGILAFLLAQIASCASPSSDESATDTDEGNEELPTEDISSNNSAAKATGIDEILKELQIFWKNLKSGFKIFMRAGVVWFFIFCVADTTIFKKIREFSNPVTRFPQKGECLTSKNLTVIQAWPGFRALVAAEDFPQAMLLENNNKIAYYDRMLVKIPPKKCARQVGTYRYETKEKKW